MPFTSAITSCFSVILFKASHSLAITGLSLCNNDIISCSADGSVQCTTIPTSLPPLRSHDCHVVTSENPSRPLSVGLSKHLCSGLSTSKSGIFVCLHTATKYLIIIVII